MFQLIECWVHLGPRAINRGATRMKSTEVKPAQLKAIEEMMKLPAASRKKVAQQTLQLIALKKTPGWKPISDQIQPRRSAELVQFTLPDVRHQG